MCRVGLGVCYSKYRNDGQREFRDEQQILNVHSVQHTHVQSGTTVVTIGIYTYFGIPVPGAIYFVADPAVDCSLLPVVDKHC